MELPIFALLSSLIEAILIPKFRDFLIYIFVIPGYQPGITVLLERILTSGRRRVNLWRELCGKEKKVRKGEQFIDDLCSAIKSGNHENAAGLIGMCIGWAVINAEKSGLEYGWIIQRLTGPYRAIKELCDDYSCWKVVLGRLEMLQELFRVLSDEAEAFKKNSKDLRRLESNGKQVLDYIDAHPGCTKKEIVGILNSKYLTVTSITLQSLMKDGWIESGAGVFFLTPRGRSVLQEYERRAQRITRQNINP